MEGLAAIDEELEALAEDKDLDAIVAKAHGELPDHSESFEMIDAMISNLGEAVSVPTVEPVGIDIPKPELPEVQAVAEPQLADVPDTAVHPSAPPADGEIPETREHEMPPQSPAEMAVEADAGVDAIVSDTPSESGLDADDLFGDLGDDSQMTPAEDVVVDVSDALAQVRAMTSAPPPPAEAAPEEPAAEAPRTEPPPPPAEAGNRDSIEELDLDEIMIEDDDSFELMIDEDDADDTAVGDAEAVENALADAEQQATPPPPPKPEGEGGEEEDDAREQSFFKKIFG
jgi:hypothetical protein